MPKHAAIGHEKDEHEALIEHARRVKEILDRPKSNQYKWSKQYRHVDMNFGPYRRGPYGSLIRRAGVYYKGPDGIERRAYKPLPIGHEETHSTAILGPLEYLPPGIQGEGKPRRKKVAGKRKVTGRRKAVGKRK